MKMIILSVLRKEVREVLRDRRTLLLTLFLPLFFYPMMLGISMYLSEGEIQAQQNEGYVFGYAGFENFESLPAGFVEEESVRWIELGEDKKLEHVDAAVVLEEGKLVLLHKGIDGSGVAGRKMLELVHQQTDVELRRVEVTQAELGGKLGGAIAYFMVFLAFTGCMSVAVDVASGERERGTWEAIMATPASLMAVALGKFLFIVLMGAVSVMATFVGVGVLVAVRPQMSEAVSMLIDPYLLGSVVLAMGAVVVFFAAVLYVLSMLAKSSREAHLRASLLMMGVVLCLIFAGTRMLGDGELAMWLPVVNVAVVIKKAISGNLEWMELVVTVLVSLLSSGLILLWLSRILGKNPERAYLAN